MILITGGTGNVGRPLLNILIQQGAKKDTKIRALVRDPAKEPTQVNSLRDTGVEVVQGDLGDASSLSGPLNGVDTAFLLTPVSREQVAWKSNFIRSARQAGVKRIVNLSVAGAGVSSPLLLGRWHGQSELELEESGMKWTHLRPYDLARYNTGLFLPSARSQGAFYSTVGEGRVAMVDEQDVASVAARALLDDSHAGRTYTLTGPAALTYSEMAAAIGEALGKPVRYIDVSEAEAKAAMLGMGLPEWIVDFINDLRRLERGGVASAVSDDIRQVTGRDAIPYSESLHAALADSQK